MDNADLYFTRAELAFRQERVRNGWRPVRRRRRTRDVAPPARRWDQADETRC